MTSTPLAALRRADTPGHQDLRAWRFRDEWSDDDPSTVLAWADAKGCVLHEAQCAHSSRTEEPSAEGRVGEARELFATEQPKGTLRYFGFCGHCLVERIPNHGWTPTDDDLRMLGVMQQVLNDVRVLREKPITTTVLMTRMGRYGAAPTRVGLKRLIVHHQQTRGDEEIDLSPYVVL